jgi:hypothetical protein
MRVPTNERTAGIGAGTSLLFAGNNVQLHMRSFTDLMEKRRP